MADGGHFVSLIKRKKKGIGITCLTSLPNDKIWKKLFDSMSIYFASSGTKQQYNIFRVAGLIVNILCGQLTL